MKLDNTDYKIILESFYQLAINEDIEISDDDIAELDEQELENRLLALRKYFGRLEIKSRFKDQ